MWLSDAKLNRKLKNLGKRRRGVLMLYSCPYDFLKCDEVICGLGYDACRVKLEIGSYGVCPRFKADVDVFRCSRDGLPCNRFILGLGFGGCVYAVLRDEVAVCCHRLRVRAHGVFDSPWASGGKFNLVKVVGSE